MLFGSTTSAVRVSEFRIQLDHSQACTFICGVSVMRRACRRYRFMICGFDRLTMRSRLLVDAIQLGKRSFDLTLDEDFYESFHTTFGVFAELLASAPVGIDIDRRHAPAICKRVRELLEVLSVARQVAQPNAVQA